jgi:hypothetical protein
MADTEGVTQQHDVLTASTAMDRLLRLTLPSFLD